MVKRCGRCKQLKEWALFAKHKNKPNGLSAYCLGCMAIKRREWKLAHPEKLKAMKVKEYCKRWLAKNPGRSEEDYYSRVPFRTPLDKERPHRDSRLRQHYGITLADRQRMERNQGGRCAICRCKCDALMVDHNHTTGKVRELLCNTCNTTVGFVEKQAERITKAFQYVRKHSSTCNVLPMRECVGNQTGSTYTLFSLQNPVLGQAEETVN